MIKKSKVINKNFFKTVLEMFFLFLFFFIFPLLIIFSLYYIISLFFNNLIVDTNLTIGLISIPVFVCVYCIYKKFYGFNSAIHNWRMDELSYFNCLIVFMCIISIMLLITKSIDLKSAKSLLLSSIGSALLAGISEEIFFRGIIISYLKKIFKEKLKGDFYIIFISSILFTLLHFLNLSYTHIIIANLLQQVFAAFCFGIFLGSIYLINRHLRICILIHFLWDLFVSLLKPIVFNKMMRITIILLFILFEVFIAIFGYLKLCNNMKRE